jgi:6-phosphogluconate dehydrogenase
MGANLARNIASKGFPVAGYDLDAGKTRAFAAGQSAGSGVGSADAPERLMAVLERPRRVLMMVPAGAPVDSVIAHLRPHLEREDILIDGGNSFFKDTDRRADELAAGGFRFVGMGVSGGEEGALRGPSMMPGGPREAWDALAPILRAMAAKAEDGEPCVAYMGPRGAGHYVKMIHNGIEYGDVLSRAAGMAAQEIAAIFASWNEGELRSYLIEITARVLERVDAETGTPLVDLILDEAQQKGTGKWMSQNSFDVGAPIPTVNAAVEARLLSALKTERMAASQVLAGPTAQVWAGLSRANREKVIESARQALYAAKITSYAQGMALLRLASIEYKYDIDPGEVAKIWRAGCIIRASLLSDIRNAFSRNPRLVNLMIDEHFATALASAQQALREVVQTAAAAGIPVPALGSSLAYYDSYRSARLPANLTQGQRDYFGAHTYRRTDRDGVFHTEWTHA